MKDHLTSFEKLLIIVVVLLLAGTPLFDVQNVTGNPSEGYRVTQSSIELSIESVIADKTHVINGERINVTVTVRNDGDEEARYVDLHYKINSEYQYFKCIDEVGPNGSGYKVFVFQENTKGKYTLTFTGKDNGDEFDEKSVEIYVDSETIYVDDDAPDGGDGSLERPFNYIQDAVNASEDGDTIRVFNGTYYENVRVNKGVNIIGNGSKDTTIDGGGSGDVVKITADWVNMSGFMVTGSGGSPFSGIKVESDHNHIFETNSSNNYYGINHEYSSYNNLTNNTCENNSFGIFLYSSSENTLTNNTASNNIHGIWIWHSSNCTLVNNTCSNNTALGIYLEDSSDCTITNNTFEENDYGIYLYRSNDCTITNNTCENNDRYGIDLSDSDHNTLTGNRMWRDGIVIHGSGLEHWNTHGIDTTNTVNGRPVYYYKNASGITVPSGAGQVILANSTDMVVENQNLSNSGIGIQLGFSSNVTISNNSCSDNRDGIYLWDSSNCTLTNNTCSANNDDGICLYRSSNVTIENNTSSNNYYGICLYDSSSDCTIENNTCNSNNYHSISLYRSSNVTIENNTSSNNDDGIYLAGSSACTIENNICSSNIDYGIYLRGSSACTIKNNTCSSNIDYGIYLEASSTCTITNNTCSSNNRYGIYLRGSSNVTIENNTITENRCGIYLRYSSRDNIAHYNNIFNNSEFGIDASENDGYSINATKNWWGHPSGPFHPTNNSEGKGDNVSDYIEFDPWLSQKILWQTLYVAKSGNDTAGNGTKENPFLTIQKAVDESNDWDTIRVFEGVYEENVVVNKSVEIVGNGSKETMLQGIGESQVVMSMVGEYNTAGNAHDVVLSGGYAYIADENNGLVVVNVSDPENPQYVGEDNTANNARGIAVSGGYAYVADSSNGLVVVDVSDPENPQYAGKYDMAGQAWGVAVSDDYAYIANDNEGLFVVNVSDPENPQLAGHYKTHGPSRSVVLNGSYAYIADGFNGLRVIDVSDPENPQLAGSRDTAHMARGVALSGDYAYVADQENGLVVVDVSDPEKPRLAGHYDTAGGAYGVSVSSGYAYVADWHRLVVVNVSDPENPQYAGGYDTAGDARGVALGNGFAYIADGDNGLVIVEIHFPPKAALYITADHALISGLTIRNGSQVGLLVKANNLEIEHCGITGNGDGIRVFNGSENIEIHNCDIFRNEGIGINAIKNKGITVSAEYNWWDHPSGPFHPTSNPNGKGNAISKNVDFEPWLDRPNNFKVHHVSPEGNDTAGTGDEGSPYRTIQKAIDVAQDWDTVKVAPGTYSESITINMRNVTIIGDSPVTTILDADGAATTCTLTADDIELNSFTVRNGNDNGIHITISSRNRLVNCIFPDNYYDINLSYSKNNQLINTTFESVNFNDSISSISVIWPLDLRVVDNRSGFIPNAHLKITDAFGTPRFDGYADEKGRIPQMLLLGYYQNISSQIVSNPYTISVWGNGYLNFSEEFIIESYAPVTCELQNHNLPQANISGDLVRHVDMDSPISFDGSESTGRSILYYWEFGDTSYSSSPTPSHTYTSPGVYQVNLMVIDDYDNTSITSIAVIVENVIPTTHADSDMDLTFEDEAIQFDASGCWDTPSDILSLHWDFGDGSQSNYEMPIHTYKNQGDYEISLTVMDMYGGESTTYLYITVTNKAPWGVSAGEDISTYVDHDVEFQGNAIDTISDFSSLRYSWDFGDGFNAGGQNVTHTYKKPGVFEVNLTVKDNNGSPTYSMINVTVKEPKIEWNLSDTIISQDETLYFNASHELDDGSFSYYWNFGDGSTAVGKDTSHTYNRSGIFSPYLIIDDGIENVTIFLQEIVVNNVIPTPRIIVDKFQVSEDESLLFDASGSWDSPSDGSHLIYIWDFGDGSTGPGITIHHAFIEMGSYTVLLTVSDGKSTNSTQVEIEVENVLPTANAGIPKEREAIVGIPVILDASNSLDTDTDLQELNYTWKIGDNRKYGKVVSYTFETSGNFSVILEVRDNNGAVSEDTLTIEVSKSSESEDEEMMSTISWILVVVIVVFLVVIGFLITAMKDEAAYKEMKAEKEASDREIIAEEEVIVVEGEIDEEMFKPKDDVQETSVEVAGEQDGEMADAEVEMGEGEIDEESFKPKDDAQGTSVKVAEEQDGNIADVAIEVEDESESASNGIENGER